VSQVKDFSAVSVLKEGIAAAKAGNRPAARLLLQRATDLDPENELAWLWRAGLTESLEDAKSYMQRVLRINPANERALAGLEWVEAQMARRRPIWECPLCQTGHPERASKCPTCGAILALSDVDALLDNLDVDERRVRQAIERYENALPDRATFGVHYNLALAYLNLRDLEAGIQHLQTAAWLKGGDSTLLVQASLLLRRKAEAQAAATQEEQPARGAVLVVDDSPTVCKLVTITLEKHGYGVTTAADGLEALARINDGLPDLILLDIMMPRLDGYQVCKIIKGNEETKHIPVVMLSGKDGFFDKVRGRMVGSTEYITKPFEPDSLLQVMEKHINHQVD
jgi:twitching motility two-component system response regulator PilG